MRWAHAAVAGTMFLSASYPCSAGRGRYGRLLLRLQTAGRPLLTPRTQCHSWRSSFSRSTLTLCCGLCMSGKQYCRDILFSTKRFLRSRVFRVFYGHCTVDASLFRIYMDCCIATLSVVMYTCAFRSPSSWPISSWMGHLGQALTCPAEKCC